MSKKPFTITKTLHDTIFLYGIKHLSEKHNEKLLQPTKLALDENDQVIKKKTEYI